MYKNILSEDFFLGKMHEFVGEKKGQNWIGCFIRNLVVAQIEKCSVKDGQLLVIN